MAKTLRKRALEGSTYGIRVDFLDLVGSDEVGVPAIPNELSWTLKDESGAVVNNKLNVPLTPAETMYIVLSGDDLVLTGNYVGAIRYVVLTGTYDSAILGSDRPLRAQVNFQIENVDGDEEVV